MRMCWVGESRRRRKPVDQGDNSGGVAMKKLVQQCLTACLCLLVHALGASAAAAADTASGKLVVDGKAVELTHVYAYMDKTFNEGKDAVVIVLADAAIPPEAVQDAYARNKLVSAGTLHYVELLVVAGKQTHYEVQHKRFGMMMQPSGDDSDHVLEGKADGKSVTGHARTTAAQKSLDDVPYSYDVTFAATVAAGKP